jgi:hypothetical protein
MFYGSIAGYSRIRKLAPMAAHGTPTKSLSFMRVTVFLAAALPAICGAANEDILNLGV